jgi:uncharacterized protein (TIGR03435 family)
MSALVIVKHAPRWVKYTIMKWIVDKPEYFLYLVTCSLLAACTGAVAAQNAPEAKTSVSPTFEVATIKSAPEADPSTGVWSPPGIGRFTATHVSLALLIQLAYGVDKSQLANKPSWLDDSLYDIAAKPTDGVALNREELKPRLQDLLKQRFHLVVHTETRLIHGYALVIAKGGPHLSPTKGDHFPGFRVNVSPGEMRGLNWSMPILAKYLTAPAGFPVIDETDLKGSYDISFSYAPDQGTDNSLPSLDAALKETTGLTLKSQMVPVLTIVIDSAEKTPTAN